GHHHRLHAVGDDLAGDEGEVHALVSHGDTVGDGDGAELQWISPAGVHPVLRAVREPVQGEVAGGDLVTGGGDTDLRFAPIRIVHPHGAQHAASRGGFDAVGDLPGPGLDIHFFVGARHGFTIGTST